MATRKLLQRFLVVFTMEKGKSHALIGLVKVWSPDKKRLIGKCELYAEDDIITISDLTITERYRKRKYGSLIIEIIKSYAYLTKMPVVLYSAWDAVDFYRKLGFKAETDKDREKRIDTIKGAQASDCNLYWIPASIEKGKKIKLTF
jgi:N-acetylglutamate synthase-like GNAT family acetyltransferase